MKYTKDRRGCCEDHDEDKICKSCGHETLSLIWDRGTENYYWECRYCKLLEAEKIEIIYQVSKKTPERITIIDGNIKYTLLESYKEEDILMKIVDEKGNIQTVYYESVSNKIFIDNEKYIFETKPYEKRKHCFVK